MSKLDLTGRVAIVTGAGRGIGASCAVQLASQGARLALVGRAETKLLEVTSFITESGGEALPIVCDVTDDAAVGRMVREVRDRLGPVDILVNNAAVMSAATFMQLEPADWDSMWRTNVRGVLACTRAALDDMLPRRSGVVVTVASVSGVENVEKLPGLSVYAATKAAVVAWTEALAAEVREEGVRVVCVSPGSVRTDMLQAVAPDASKSAMKPGRVAEVVGFLCSDMARGVTQTNVVVWGPPGGEPDGPAELAQAAREAAAKAKPGRPL